MDDIIRRALESDANLAAEYGKLTAEIERLQARVDFLDKEYAAGACSREFREKAALTAKLRSVEEQIHEREYEKRAASLTSWICPICLSADTGFFLTQMHTPCGHVFHARCMKRWLENGSTVCPMCRARIS